MRLSPRERWIGFATVAVAALYIWFTLQPDLLLANTTTNGGDTGAHVWWPAYLRDHILPKWRLTGWTPDWYAGFPGGFFYFPLPSLLIVALDVLLPYNVAFKLVTVLGPVMLPVGAYSFARGIGARWPAPPLFAVATLPFLFYTGYTIWGGNLASTLAGEFSFTIALALGLFFLGALARALDERQGLAVAAALLAATVMSHLIVAVFVAVGAVVIWLQRRPIRNLRPAVAVAGVAFLVTAIWTLPLVFRLGYTTDMGWTKEPPMGPNNNLLPDDLRWAFVLGAAGALAGLVLRRRGTIGLFAMAAIFGVAFVVMPESRLWNARLMPFYYLMVLFLAATAVAELVVLLARAAPGIGRAIWYAVSTPEPDAPELPAVDPSAEPVFGPPEPLPQPAPTTRSAVPPPPGAADWRRFVAGSVAAAIALLGAMEYTHSTRKFLPAWIRWNYSGYEAKPAYAEFKEVIETMGNLPPGRALWEPSSDIDRYGTTLALELLPHFTDGKIGSMEGLYFESAATTPYHFMVVSALAKSPSNPVRGLEYRTLNDFEHGVAQMRLLGVRYYMAQSDEAKARADESPGLRYLTETGSPSVTPSVARWRIYEVLDAPLVEPLRNEPVVVDGISHKHWLEPSAAWFNDESALDRLLADGGPEGWVRAGEDDARFTPKKPLPAVTVSNIEADDDSVRFEVSEPGVPVLVKTSYFPNWQVKGAKGPWRVSPNLMVVVPTDTSVDLHFGRTPVDWAVTLFTVFGLVGLAGLARWKLVPLAPRPAWRRRQEAAGAPPADGSGPPEPGPAGPSEDESAPVLA
ncbi:MAG TPA: 6-pyruvoyl-tetrahydropterin synthase-related protein [Acidimicrobiia bacterium]|nr:6-pyruvoyl-tetrahydropterin synthase-related protein [Acidimicrobiia bacterium]